MRSQGKKFEDLAAKYLIAQGLVLIESNSNFKCGEIDLIMQDKDTVVFVEVRQRKSNLFGDALESVNKTKQKKWIKAAQMWLNQRGCCLEDTQSRFDLVTFDGLDHKIDWIINFIDDTNY